MRSKDGTMGLETAWAAEPSLVSTLQKNGEIGKMPRKELWGHRNTSFQGQDQRIPGWEARVGADNRTLLLQRYSGVSPVTAAKYAKLC